MYDLIIKNGKVINGTGSPAFYADVAIKDGKIAAIGKNLQGADKTIDAKGLVVTPGFIDSHGHNDEFVLSHPDQTEKIEQGITTTVAGQCGSSAAPIGKWVTEEDAYEVGTFGKSTYVYKTMANLLNVAKNVPQGSNVATYVGHSDIRRAVVGRENRKPTPEEMQAMCDMLREDMKAGAMGVSFGLFYAPGCYAETEECIALAKVVAEFDGVVSAHIRDEGDFLVQSVREFITIIRESGARGVISHHKATERPENWGKVSHTLRMIDEANEQGIDVYCDVYPYIASHTNMMSYFTTRESRAVGLEQLSKNLREPEMRAEMKQFILDSYSREDLSWVQVTICPAHPEFCGKKISDIAKELNKDEYETLFDIMCDCKMQCSCCCFSMCEEDVCTVMAHPRAMICTDSGLAAGKVFFHPRLKASFPRVLGKYVRAQGVTSLPEMIRKITSMPASVYGFKTKGLVWEGMDADLCIFDPEKIVDKADFIDCHRRAEGLNYVVLGGEIVVENAVFNGKRCGKVLLRK